MYRYILCVSICTVIWIVNGICIIEGIKKQILSETYTHIGLSIFFTLLAIELTLGSAEAWMHFNILWLKVIGWVLYIPSAFLTFGSLITLKHKGKPETHDFTSTTTLINTGIYRIVSQPMTLGMAIWSIALILVFQSIISIILGIASTFCFWMGAKKETEKNIKKFGDTYKEYINKVPMWNVFKRLRK
ncbi:hypothetical protein KAW65_05845 [candidate division WOR-3 bacterium]|nr:hypothetical protein [candidate division WOR-3 bacterium]